MNLCRLEWLFRTQDDLALFSKPSKNTTCTCFMPLRAGEMWMWRPFRQNVSFSLEGKTSNAPDVVSHLHFPVHFVSGSPHEHLAPGLSTHAVARCLPSVLSTSLHVNRTRAAGGARRERRRSGT